MEQNQETSLFGLNIDQNSSSVLRAAAQWGKIFAICGFILAFLCIILGIVMQSTFSAASREFDGEFRGGATAGIAGTAALFIYVIIGLVYFLSSIFLLNFANKTTKALRTNDQTSLVGGFSGLRNFLALWAILMIICLLLVIFALLSTAMI